MSDTLVTITTTHAQVLRTCQEDNAATLDCGVKAVQARGNSELVPVPSGYRADIVASGRLQAGTSPRLVVLHVDIVPLIFIIVIVAVAQRR